MTKKQAVLLIHGIGEQKPMDTLRGFVDTVWATDKNIHHHFAGAQTWSKPDNVSRSFELRRLTTPQNKAEIKTDFFEFYWAHLMEGTSYGHVLAWARTLLLRKPSTVPPQLKAVYWLLVAILALALALAVYAAYAKASGNSFVPAWLSIVASLALLPLAAFLILRVVGDAARYLHAAPTNIQRRHEIRTAGIELLKELHKAEREYDRIIIVGQSLGSVIGYDMLNHAWSGYNNHTVSKDSMEALKKLEALAGDENDDTDQVQKEQRRYFEELKANGCGWRVTDFITLGSPLAHATVLLATDAKGLKGKQENREFPTCLPALETAMRDKLEVRRFSYEVDRSKKDSYRVPHHAAVFAPTCWTNLYFPCHAIFWGDIIGGPLKAVMGKGVRDIAVSTRQWGGMFSHTLYWTQPAREEGASHIQSLREALDLIDARRDQA